MVVKGLKNVGMVMHIRTVFVVSLFFALHLFVGQ